MRAIIQRVSKASVEVSGSCISSIEQGLLVLLGIESEDGKEDIEYLVQKIANMRIFQDDDQKMNLSLLDVKGSALIVSQFTLHASTKKGNRPSFIRSAPPQVAEKLYEDFVDLFKSSTSLKVETGEFGAMMEISLINHGPVTIFIDSKNKQ